MNRKHNSVTARCFAACSAIALATVTTAAFAADAGKEVATAAQHAGLAAQATIVDTVHAHLHHTVNCLVGPTGAGFDAKQMNPCQGMGNGAIPDTADAGKKTALTEALATANAGLAASDLAAATKAAADTEAALKKAM